MALHMQIKLHHRRRKLQQFIAPKVFNSTKPSAISMRDRIIFYGIYAIKTVDLFTTIRICAIFDVINENDSDWASVQFQQIPLCCLIAPGLLVISLKISELETPCLHQKRHSGSNNYANHLHAYNISAQCVELINL